MSLTLTVLSFKNQPITEINAVTIGNNGGGIGRSDDNALMLPDTEKFVSRHHATISWENGGYYLSDTSLGGVYLSNRETPLHNATERITDGMILRVGEYEIAVAIADEPVADDFSFASEPMTFEPAAFHQADEPWLVEEDVGFNSLMTDNFPSHEELVHTKTDAPPVAFESALQSNHSPLFDSYIAPGVSPSPASEGIPDNFSFDDFFSEPDSAAKPHAPLIPAVNKPAVDDDFDDFFGAAISDMGAETDELAVSGDSLTEDTPETGAIGDPGSPPFAIEPALSSGVDQPVVTMPETESGDNNIKTAVTKPSLEKTPRVPADSVLFDAFLQGAVVECNEIRPDQQTETLYRIGQMFRKLIDGTVAVLRSRAEFKSLCRVNMTVIRATDNNPLKFTVATDDVLRQLIENKTDGFLGSTAAIEESFNDIMNHQLAMQAGIQASLTDLLKTFDPNVIEKQFEQGIVLQKKSKCWDRYEETYRNTVEDAVENFFGEEFVKAYEKQMSLLTNARRK